MGGGLISIQDTELTNTFTCCSLKCKTFAIVSRSGTVRYFCFLNLSSRTSICWLVKTVLVLLLLTPVARPPISGESR